jgi:molybdopterin-guanine dinucleotide biosynthesis protein A
MPSEPHEPGLGAIVLVGGRSIRMGSAKALLDWHGSTMARRITGIVGRAASPVVVVHEVGQELPPLPGAELVADAAPGRGPLEGIAAGMRALTGRCRCVFVSGTDLPLLHPEFVRSVARALDGYEMVAPVADGRSHPLAAVYRLEALSRVEILLADDRRRAAALLESEAAHRLDAAALPHPESLRNLNTPQEYAQALAEPEPEIVIEAVGTAGRLVGFTTLPLRAATLGRAIAAAGLGEVLGDLSLELNGEPLQRDPATPLVAGDTVAVTS